MVKKIKRSVNPFWGPNVKAKPMSSFGFMPIKLNTSKNIRNIPRKNLTWAQASIRYPKMQAFGDADRDSILNAWDCKPFDRRRHGKFVQNIPLDKAKYLTLYHGSNFPRQVNKEGLKANKIRKGTKELEEVEKGIFLTPSIAIAGAYARGNITSVGWDASDDTQEGEIYKTTIKVNPKDFKPSRGTHYYGKQIINPSTPKSTILKEFKEGEYIYTKDIPPEKLKVVKKDEVIKRFKFRKGAWNDHGGGGGDDLYPDELNELMDSMEYDPKTKSTIFKDLNLSEQPEALESFEPKNKRLTKESDSNRARRLRMGMTKIKEIDAAEFKRKWEEQERDTPERESIKLDWNPDRLKTALERNEDDDYPKVSITKDRVDVGDGRHRISAAAEKGQKINVATYEDLNDNQIPDKAENVDIKPIKMNNDEE